MGEFEVIMKTLQGLMSVYKTILMFPVLNLISKKPLHYVLLWQCIFTGSFKTSSFNSKNDFKFVNSSLLASQCGRYFVVNVTLLLFK